MGPSRKSHTAHGVNSAVPRSHNTLYHGVRKRRSGLINRIGMQVCCFAVSACLAVDVLFEREAAGEACADAWWAHVWKAAVRLISPCHAEGACTKLKLLDDVYLCCARMTRAA